MGRFRFVEDHAARYPVKRLCTLVEVSRSGFYARRGRPSCPREGEDVELIAMTSASITRSVVAFVHGPTHEGPVTQGEDASQALASFGSTGDAFDCEMVAGSSGRV